MGLEPLETWVRGVQLFLVPREEMTWWMWTNALWGMRMAVGDNAMFFEWSFGVAVVGVGEGEGTEVGYGTLRDEGERRW